MKFSYVFIIVFQIGSDCDLDYQCGINAEGRMLIL